MESYFSPTSYSNILTQNALLASIISTTCCGLLASYFYYKYKYNYWRARGVKGPKPKPIVGNLLTLLLGNRMKIEREWIQQYGKVYGIFQGNKPRLVIADPELARQIYIKDFDYFPNHQIIDYLNKYQSSFLFFQKDEQWKKNRVLLSPTFTSGKIKRMYKLLEVCSDDLMNCITEQLPDIGEKAQMINVKELYSLYTLDAIASCCYGIKLDRAGSTNVATLSQRNDFVAVALKVFNVNFPRFVLSAIAPEFILRAFNFAVVPEAMLDPVAKRIASLIKARRVSTKKFDDYLQLLIDARIEDEMELGEIDKEENHHAGLSTKSLLEDQKKMVEDVMSQSDRNKLNVLTDLEVLASATLLMLVGVETTGNLLSGATYALAFHPAVQERLYSEIAKIAIFDEKKKIYNFDYEILTSCQYLDSVISETLRCLPPILTIDRKCKRDYKIEKYGIDMPEGMMLNIAIYALHTDPDLWKEPNRFNPDRFMPGNKENIVPGSYCPFGMGPRHCLGMRFSLTETKLALAKALMQFRFEPAPETLFPPEPKMSFGLNSIKRPLVRVVLRD